MKPLAGMVIVISTYAGDERAFLLQLAEILGADCHDAYKKVARPVLICPSTENAKYNAAIKWSKLTMHTLEHDILIDTVSPFHCRSARCVVRMVIEVLRIGEEAAIAAIFGWRLNQSSRGHCRNRGSGKSATDSRSGCYGRS